MEMAFHTGITYHWVAAAQAFGHTMELEHARGMVTALVERWDEEKRLVGPED